MSKLKLSIDQKSEGREVRNADRSNGGVPIDKIQGSHLNHEPTKHPAKVTIPDLK